MRWILGPPLRDVGSVTLGAVLAGPQRWLVPPDAWEGMLQAAASRAAAADRAWLATVDALALVPLD